MNAVAVVVHDPEDELSRGVALLRGSAIPPRRLGVVLGNALAFGVHVPEIELSPGVAPLGVNPEPSKGRGMVTSLVRRDGFFECLSCGGRRAHDRQQQCRGHGEESSRPVRRAHVSPVPFEPTGPSRCCLPDT